MTEPQDLPCVQDVTRRLAVRQATGKYPPSAFDVLIESPRGIEHDIAVREARAMCGACPIMRKCLTVDNRDELWALSVLNAPRLPAREREECGTTRGYGRHNRNRETACRPCLDAQAKAGRERAAARRAARKQPVKQGTLAQRRAQARAEDLRDMIATGADLDEVCTRLGIIAKSLWNWCKRNDQLDLWQALNPPQPEALVKVRRRGERGAA